MTTDGQLEPGHLSRRTVVKGMGLAGAAALFGGSLVRVALRGEYGPSDTDVVTHFSGAPPELVAAVTPSVTTEPLGVWGSPFTPTDAVSGIHAVLLHTGKVLLIESTGAYVWDPVSGAGQRANPPNDIFCAAHTVLGNGEVLVTGGRLLKAGRGPRYTSTFDPSTALWTRRPDMRQGRWYPTSTLLADGRVVITAGKTQTGGTNTDVEVYDNGTISLLNTRKLPFYPNQFVLPTGKVLIVARNTSVLSLDAASGAATALARMKGIHAAGPAVLLPGPPSGSSTVMICGGKSKTSTASAEVESFDASTPSVPWVFRAPLPGKRVHMNLVILPDGRILGVGGTDGAVGQLQSLLYDPPTDTWTPMASQIEERGYHSTATLLPDGRVLSAGDNQTPGGKAALEVYSPPYLYQGERPVILSSPATATWGSTLPVGTSDPVARAVLIRPGAVTHSVNMDQRHVELAFTSTATGILATAPPSPAVAPPGHYMLFLLNAEGVPSVANWIRFTGTP